ncbi:MAG: DUF4336 domain-containing protein [Pseudomonadota bacterium]|nr:DUF4336 domain-containing protein [Pseudomonadota bacterium]
MLTPIAPGIWHAQRDLKVAGIAATSRMTVIQLADGGLWLHSPILIDEALRAALAAIGPVNYVVAPNKVHHLFAKKCLAMYPQARLFGAPGLEEKRPDLPMTALTNDAPTEWAGQIGQVFMAGIPRVNETVFFHVASGTAIVTDICQLWTGPLGWKESVLAYLTGVRHALTVPRTVRLIIQDKAALRTSALQVLAWPVKRVVVAHNSIVEDDAHAALTRALGAI